MTLSTEFPGKLTTTEFSYMLNKVESSSTYSSTEASEDYKLVRITGISRISPITNEDGTSKLIKKAF